MMKFITFYFVLSQLLVINLVSQSLGATTHSTPKVHINSPIDGSVVVTTNKLVINITAEDQDGTIQQVALYRDGQYQGKAIKSPYIFELINLVAGTNIFTAVATDNEGLTATSSPVTIIVEEPRLPYFFPTINILSSTQDVILTAPADFSMVVSANVYRNGLQWIIFKTIYEPFGSTQMTVMESHNLVSTMALTNLAVGTYRFNARVTDVYENSAETAWVKVTVLPPADGPSEYGMIDLGTLGGHSSMATGLNDQGLVAGTSLVRPNSEERRAFLWQNGTMRDFPPATGQTFGIAVNNNQTFLGITDDGNVPRGFIAPALGEKFVLPGLEGDYSNPSALNDQGVIAGWAKDSMGRDVAVTWQESIVLALSQQTSGRALAINNRGEVVGQINTGTFGVAHAAWWSNGTMRDLGVLTNEGGTSSVGFGINDSGDVVGSANDSNSFNHAVKWSNGIISRLTPFPGLAIRSHAKAINDQGYIVGGSTPLSGLDIAMLWVNGVPYPLDAIVTNRTGRITHVAGINNKGQIAAIMNLSGGLERAVLLNPASMVPPSRPPVVSLTSPKSTEIIGALQPVTLAATVESPDAAIERVHFYSGNTEIGMTTNSPYVFTWTPRTAGSYCLKAVAVDLNRNLGASPEVCVNVLAAAPKYTLANLGPLTTTGERPYAINAMGALVGSTRGFGAFLYSGGNVTYFNKPDMYSILATAINDLEQVVLVDNQQRASLYSDGVFTNLPALPPGHRMSVPRAINNKGQVVGEAVTDNGETHAVLWENGTIVDIGATLGMYSQADDINNGGSVVGWYQSAPGKPALGFIYHPSSGFGTLGESIQPKAINDHGVIVGQKGTQAVVLVDGEFRTILPLGGSPSVAVAINNAGQIVGQTRNSYGQERAFISSGQGMSDLNEMLPADTTVILRGATGINDRGQIVAYGNPSAESQETKVYLLNPVPGPGKPNTPPIVAIDQPVSGAVYYEGDTIPINASATDPDGNVVAVDFYANTAKISSSSIPPYSAQWQNATAAVYSVSAIATDNYGLSTTSAPVSVTIKAFDTNAPAVAILTSAPADQAADVRTKLRRTESFSKVDILPVGGQNALPTLQRLKQYKAILVFSTFGANLGNADGVGNLLASYIDGGGGVVLGLRAGDIKQNLVRGRFLSEGYFPWTEGFLSSHGTITMLKDLPEHPILAGVEHFHGGYSAEYLDQFTLIPGSVSVASWATRAPMVVTRIINAGRLVGLNMKPVSADAIADGWDSSSDGARLMGNSLLWAGSISQGTLSLKINGTNQVSLRPGKPITIAATSTNLPQEGFVAFYTNQVLMAVTTNLPAQFIWTNPPVGEHLITAVYTNSLGTMISAPGVLAKVDSILSISLVTPVDNTVVYLPTNILMQVNVSATDAPIAKVEYFLRDSQRIATVTQAPYSFNFTQFTIGTLYVSAVVTDALGAKRTSATHLVHVFNPALPRTTSWTQFAGDWGIFTNWNSGPPRLQDTGIIDNGGEARIKETAATAATLRVGTTGSGTVLQSSGTLQVPGEIVLGETETARGSIYLQGGLLSAGTMVVGLQGRGSVVQHGGTLQTAVLVSSDNLNIESTYELYGGILQSDSTKVAASGRSVFSQYGGTNNSKVLRVGSGNSSLGIYQLNDGSLNVDLEFIGSPRSLSEPLSTFAQTGGNHTVKQELQLGVFNEGILTVSGGQLTAAQFIMGRGGMLEITGDKMTNHLTVTGKATFDGGLTIKLPADHVLLGGDVFTLMTYGSREGAFLSTNLPPSQNGIIWSLEYGEKALLLRALPPLEVVVISPVAAAPQASLFQQTVILSNHGTEPMLGARIYFPGLADGWELFNAAGKENGIPYLETDLLILPGSSVQLQVQFLNRQPTELPNSSFLLQFNSVLNAGGSSSPPLNVEKTSVLADGSVAISFSSVHNRTYWISYSSDLIHWQFATQPVIATSSLTHWTDTGIPKTAKHPQLEKWRFYRIIEDQRAGQ